MLEVLLPIFFIIFVFIGSLVQYRYEKNIWNNGVCSISGLEWECFDMDSQGARMYKDGMGNYCDISYNVDVIRRCV